MSKLIFAWPAPGGNEWSPEAAQSLIGQKLTFDGKQGKVTACTMDFYGNLIVDIKIYEENVPINPPGME